MSKLVCVWIIVLALAACAKPATPDPNQVSQLVQQAVQATLTAQATQPPAPMDTAVPPTAMPTATAVQSRATTVPTVAPTDTPLPPPTATPAPTETPTLEPTPTPTQGPEVSTAKAANLRAGPGTNYPVIGSTRPGDTYAILGRNDDGTWFEICCVNAQPAWIAAVVASTSGAVENVEVAQNIPTPPPTATPAPLPTAAPAATQAPVVQRPGLHARQTIGTWEIQAERVQNEKAVYEYSNSKVAMGRYAIVFVLAKNLASGTQDMNSALAPMLRDDKGRIYDYSDPLTTERMAMIYACWEFSVGKTVFDDINPGVETPLVMLWDVSEDVQSLTLILTDGNSEVEWDLGDFANIPPYKPQ